VERETIDFSFRPVRRFPPDKEGEARDETRWTGTPRLGTINPCPSLTTSFRDGCTNERGPAGLDRLRATTGLDLVISPALAN
jgi:hypothetical protein